MVLAGALSVPQQTAEGAYPVALPSAPQRTNAAKQYLARILGGSRYRATPVSAAPQGKLGADDGHDTPTSVLCPTAFAKHATASACSTSSSSSLIKAGDDFCYTPASTKNDMQCDDTRDQDFEDAQDGAPAGELSSSSCATCLEAPASPCSQVSMASVHDADLTSCSSSSSENSPRQPSATTAAAACAQPQASLTSEFLQMQSLTYLTIQNINFVTFNQQDMACLASCTGLTRLHWTDNSDLPTGGVSTALATLVNLSHLHLDTKACKAHEVLPHCHGSLSRLTSLTLVSGDTHLGLQQPVQWQQLAGLQRLAQLTLRPAPELTKIRQWLPCLASCQFPDVEGAGVSEYLQELQGKERTSWVRSGSMVGLQREVTLGMRAVLVDWMIEIADEWRLQWESLHLGVSLLDKFLATRRVPRRSLQLVAVTCLWEGAKYHELHPPTSRECARLVDSKCHWRDVVRMEQTVLEVVGFDMGVPTVATFLHAYMAGIAQDELVPAFAKYFCDLAVIHYSTTRFPPSFLAAAALWLAVGLGRMHAPEACVVPGLKQAQKDLTAAVQELVTAYKWASYGAGRSSYVKQKYSHRRFHRVAKLPLSNANLTA